MTVDRVHDYQTFVIGLGVSWREHEIELRLGPWGWILTWSDE